MVTAAAPGETQASVTQNVSARVYRRAAVTTREVVAGVFTFARINDGFLICVYVKIVFFFYT